MPDSAMQHARPTFWFRSGWLLAIALVVVSTTGASCPRLVQQYTEPIPRALPPQASITQIINVVNDNTARVQSLSSSRATITTPGYPALNARINMTRPRSLRITGEKFGPQLDVGSNNELLWIWIAQSQPPALFYVRHEQYAQSAARQIMPVEPDWLVEAFGLTTFDQAAPLEGPSPIGSGRVQIRRKVGPPGMETTRVTVIDDSRGVVLEQHVYDMSGQLLASAVLSGHALDATSGAKLPRKINVQWPPAKLELAIEMSDLSVNQLQGDPTQLFTKPSYSGYNELDLAQPGLQLTPTAAGQFQNPPTTRY
jgi:hypothetical protein